MGPACRNFCLTTMPVAYTRTRQPAQRRRVTGHPPWDLSPHSLSTLTESVGDDLGVINAARERASGG